MNVLAVWLRACRKKCVAFFASKKAGTFLKTKSVKKEKEKGDDLHRPNSLQNFLNSLSTFAKAKSNRATNKISMVG